LRTSSGTPLLAIFSKFSQTHLLETPNAPAIAFHRIRAA
jgi:hypothetical protein